MRRAWLGVTVALLSGAAAAQTPASTPSAQTPSDGWLPRTTADLEVLDKVSTQVTPLVLKVGQAADNASLSITLRACVVRPSNMARDSAAFLDIRDSRPGTPGFHGWMFANEPALSMFENPIYGIHLVDCH